MVLSCADIEFLKRLSVKPPNCGPKWHFLYFSLFWQPFTVTIATGKVKSIRDINTWVIHLIKQSKDNVVKTLLIFGFRGGQKLLTNAHSPLAFQDWQSGFGEEDL